MPSKWPNRSDDLPYRQFIKHYGMDRPKLNAQLQQLAARARDPVRAFAKRSKPELIPGMGARPGHLPAQASSPAHAAGARRAARFIHLRHESLLLLRDAARFDDVKKFAEFQNGTLKSPLSPPRSPGWVQASKKGGGQMAVGLDVGRINGAMAGDARMSDDPDWRGIRKWTKTTGITVVCPVILHDS